MNSFKKDPRYPSSSNEVDLELGQGNLGTMMVYPQLKINAQKANERKDICSTMHVKQFGENIIDVVSKQRVWFTKKKIIACIILIILVVIGISGGSIWYFYPGEAKKNKDESAITRTKSDDDVKSPTTGAQSAEQTSEKDQVELPSPRTESDDAESSMTGAQSVQSPTPRAESDKVESATTRTESPQPSVDDEGNDGGGDDEGNDGGGDDGDDHEVGNSPIGVIGDAGIAKCVQELEDERFAKDLFMQEIEKDDEENKARKAWKAAEKDAAAKDVVYA